MTDKYLLDPRTEKCQIMQKTNFVFYFNVGETNTTGDINTLYMRACKP